MIELLRKEMSLCFLTVTLVFFLMFLAAIGLGGYLFYLISKSLKKYIDSQDMRQEKKEVRKSLGGAISEHRHLCKMIQEFVAESLGVSRQAVSKWEMDYPIRIYLIYFFSKTVQY